MPISWLLMPWLLTSPGHQQPWYWLYGLCRSFSYWGGILSTCVISMWRNDTKCKYMFMFPLKYLACKGLISKLLMSWWHWEPVLKNCLQNGGHFVNAFCVNTLRPVHNGHHFVDIFKCILLKEDIYVLIEISQIFVKLTRSQHWFR